MKRLGAACAFALAVLATMLPASARDFIQDGAQMFSASTVSSLDSRLSAFNAQTGKEVVVVTVPSLNGQALTTAAQSAFTQQNVNGVLIFIAKADRKDIVLTDNATARFFSRETILGIRQPMEAQFRNEDFDGGITSAVDGTLNVFRAHLSSLHGNGGYVSRPSYATTTYARNTGVHISMFWWIIILIVGFMVIRSIFRAMAGPRYYGGPTPGGGYGPGPGYGGPGWGGGYGYGGYGGYGGGGGFWSGLLGGLGGAWLGNELFGGNQTQTIVQQPGMDMSQQTYDQGGWANDAGQVDMGNASAGDWGGGGFGDSGGGFGGGDFGGGDSGGGW